LNALQRWLPGSLQFHPLGALVIAGGAVCVFAPGLVYWVSYFFDDDWVLSSANPTDRDRFLIQILGLAAMLVGIGLMVGWV